MACRKGLDPRQKPPEFIKSTYKKYEKLKLKEVDTDANIIDFVRGFNEEQRSKIRKIGAVNGYALRTPCSSLSSPKSLEHEEAENGPAPVYEYDELPGENSPISTTNSLS